MSGPFEAVKVSDHVYWVGAIDWGIRDFHGYSTTRGSTYNAYLVVGDDITLIDTVKAPFKDELLSRVASVTDPGNIRYIISNHSEMDHSGSLPAVIEAVKPEKVFASTLGVKDLTAQLDLGQEVTAVKDAEELELGGIHFTCFETRMIHWPDSMITYVADDKLLFSQDGFGMHLATSERFVDEVVNCPVFEEGAKYFANILLPYSSIILKMLDRVEQLGVEIDLICPDHGPIWRGEDCGWIIGLWKKWATQKPELKAVVFFDTMWGSTEKMGRAIGEALEDDGIVTVVMPLKSNDRAGVITEILEAGAIVVGSPTINNSIFPSVADVLTYVKGLKPQNLIGAAFGSYGWSGEGHKLVNQVLTDMKVELVQEPLSTKFVPDADALASCRELGSAVARRLKEVVGSGS
jgi:flavorubredoxin